MNQEVFLNLLATGLIFTALYSLYKVISKFRIWLYAYSYGGIDPIKVLKREIPIEEQRRLIKEALLREGQELSRRWEELVRNIEDGLQKKTDISEFEIPRVVNRLSDFTGLPIRMAREKVHWNRVSMDSLKEHLLIIPKCASVCHQYGLDDKVREQFLDWAGDIAVFTSVIRYFPLAPNQKAVSGR